MNTVRKPITESFKSNMEVINLHAELNRELKKFHEHINTIKQLSFFERLHLACDEECLIKKISDINQRIKNLAKESITKKEFI